MRMLRCWFADSNNMSSSCSRVGLRLISFALLLSFAFARVASAQNAPNVTTPCSSTSLCLDNTYLVSGDYVVGSVGLQGQGATTGPLTGFATGMINIPDCVQATGMGVPCSSLPVVPAGADIVLAKLIWETVESSTGNSPTGQQGFFNGYPITGTRLNVSSSSWSSGGCSGNSDGSKIVNAYSADVRPFLPLDSNGNIQANGSFQVSLRDSGKNGNTVPHTPGATLLIIYRVVSTVASMPLNAVVIYNGLVAPNNISSTFTQPIVGFYQANPTAKMTIIAGYGQTGKTDTVTLKGMNLPALYPAYPGDPFPGALYAGGSYDSPTWTGVNSPINTIVQPNDSTETAAIAPSPQNGNCVDVAAVIFSTLVPDPNLDGLLPVWKAPPSGPQGYTDAKSGQFVALPGANPNAKDIFVEIDYLENLDVLAGPYSHSHLPKQQALDMVGNAFKNAPVDCDPVTKVCKGVNVHFDVGNVYQSPLPGGPSANCGTAALPVPCDPYIISNPPGKGGHAISESALLCTDGATLCQFPSTPSSTPPVFEPTFSWKGGFLFVRDTACALAGLAVPCSTSGAQPLGNFQPGRGLSYRYLLSGHFLGDPESSWTTQESALALPTIPQLISIVNSGTTATVTLQSPAGVLKPGDCISNPSLNGCSDNNLDRVTVGGALGQPALSGTYHFSNLGSSASIINGVSVTTTTFNIATTNTTATCTTAPCVADGTYTFSNEPQLGVAYGGPTLTSGHSDFRGGGDTAVTLAWPEDDPVTNPPCQGDPSQPLQSGQAYCNNELGTPLQQAGTAIHELGHGLVLFHGPVSYNDASNPFVPTYGLNCGSNRLSNMNYMFQVRGFLDNLNIVDYSGQTLPDLDELNLNESVGVGNDVFSGKPAAHFTRWYAPPNATDKKLGRSATVHCDGSPILDGAKMVRVDGSTIPSPPLFGPTDWNNDLIAPDLTEPVAWQDVNFNGSTSTSPDPPAALKGFNDWQAIDLRQTGARAGFLGFSGIGGGNLQTIGGGGGNLQTIGGGGGNLQTIGGGGTIDQDQKTACSTADPPMGLSAVQSGKSVVLNWSAPGGPCQVSTYNIWRSTNGGPFTLIGTVGRIKNGNMTTAPPTTFKDTNVQNSHTYTYFLTDTDVQGATSGQSVNPSTVSVTIAP